MTAAAILRRQLQLRDDRGVKGTGSVIGGRTVAVLALNPFKLRGLRGADEAAGQSIADAMAGETGVVGLPAGGHEKRVGERARMRRERHSGLNVAMALRASGCAGIVRRRAGYAEKIGTVKISNGGGPNQIGGTAQLLPFGF